MSMELIFKGNRISLCIQIFLWDFKNKGFLPIFTIYFHTLCSYACQKWKALFITGKPSTELLALKKSSECITQSDVQLSKEEVVLAMKELGMSVELDGDGMQETISEQEILSLFESKELSSEEIKDAFDVFDENKDGFIEPRELQRVLCCLGIKKDLEECTRMINKVDQNGDGLVDHNEFLKFMEDGFSNHSNNP